MDWESFIHNGIHILQSNLENYPSYDPKQPYEEKNLYFLQSSEYGRSLFDSEDTLMFAEKYYTILLKTIIEYERVSGKTFNKGIAFVNLGVTQLATDKFDLGIVNMLKADQEDKAHVTHKHGIFNSNLWKQFELPKVIDFLMTLNGNSDASLHFAVTEPFLNQFFEDLDLQDRLFLEASIWAAHDNMHLNLEYPNTFSRAKLFSLLKDLCLLTESLLRKKQQLMGLVSQNTKITLGDTRHKSSKTPGLLTNALSSKGIGYPQTTPALNTGANNLYEFLSNLENILTNAISPEIKRIYCLHLVRNFTGHHFDISSHVRLSDGRELFDMYNTVLVNIISAILYLRFNSEI
jgi:hypothetical protein